MARNAFYANEQRKCRHNKNESWKMKQAFVATIAKMSAPSIIITFSLIHLFPTTQRLRDIILFYQI